VPSDGDAKRVGRSRDDEDLALAQEPDGLVVEEGGVLDAVRTAFDVRS
jgi:hypothetical protein